MCDKKNRQNSGIVSHFFRDPLDIIVTNYHCIISFLLFSSRLFPVTLFFRLAFCFSFLFFFSLSTNGSGMLYEWLFSFVAIVFTKSYLHFVLYFQTSSRAENARKALREPIPILVILYSVNISILSRVFLCKKKNCDRFFLGIE